MNIVAWTLQGVSRLFNRTEPPPSVPNYQWGGTPSQAYPRFARYYQTNEIVYAAIEMLATSASEPKIAGKKWQRESPRISNLSAREEIQSFIRNEEYDLLATGVSRRRAKQRMIRNGFYKDLPSHPLVKLLNNPNPLVSRGQLWGTVVMDRCLAGNAYLLKARYQDGPLKGKVAELWRLRPDRVRIIPKVGGIEGYEYNTGKDKVVFPAEDVMHFKTRDPLNDYYGMPPLMVLMGRLSIDEYMKRFLETFFERGGSGPGAVLSIKQKLDQSQKDEVRDRLSNMFSGANTGKTLVIDQNEHSYTQLGLNRGLRDALPAELDAVSEARIAMVFGIPGSILGLKIGYESSSYANKRQDWQVFWDLTMTPMLSDFDDVLNLAFKLGKPDAEFGAIDEVCFDLSDIRALQEDVDKLHDRARADWQASGLTYREYREALGYDPEIQPGEIIIVPSNMVALKVGDLGEEPEPVAPPPQIEAPKNIVAEVFCPQCNKWRGRNMNVGATALCRNCGEFSVTMPGEPKQVVELVYDDDDKLVQLVPMGAK